jgi:RNA recognition motif-containing protein
MDIHVFNLSQNIIEHDLLKLFSTYGHVNSVVITRDKVNGRSTGSAFVNMSNDDMARQAVLNLNQMLVDGKRIAVSEIKFSLGKYNN